MARVVIMTIGSYGDVVPYIGLGERLCAIGHDVRIAAHESSAELIAAAGLNFHDLPGPDLRVVAATAEGEAVGRAGLRETVSLIRTAADAMRRPIPAMIEAADGQTSSSAHRPQSCSPRRSPKPVACRAASWLCNRPSPPGPSVRSRSAGATSADG
ncbi:MAG: glycosyltransferase [Pseudonocardiaceae bacterium]